MSQIHAKDILKPALVLCLIALCAGLLLGAANSLTEEQIALQNEKAAAAAREAVMPGAAEFRPVEDYFEALDEAGSFVGYVFEEVGDKKGYSGALSVTVGIDSEGTILGVKPGDLSGETPGLGQNAGKPGFLQQFAGKAKPLEVVKNSPAENQIQAVTSATITSSAITSGVNKALAHYQEITGKGGAR